MWRSSVRSFIVVLFCLLSATRSRATGGGEYARPFWLDNGAAVDHSPEFFWETELAGLALSYKPPEKPLFAPRNGWAESQELARSFADQAGKADLEDFQDAIKQGRLKPSDPAGAEARHKAARDVIAAANESTVKALPEEEPSEFADYHKGALLFRHGEAHYAEARAAWEALLQRPASERHYRTVWTAFMLAKLALFTHAPEASKLFQQVRELAAEGFADSLSLAADSYGWEAKNELDQDRRERAAKLYLTQLSFGDSSALISLKALVPDREALDGELNFDAHAHPIPSTEYSSPAEKKEMEPAILKRLDEAAKSPLLRSIVTIHILATETVNNGQYHHPRCLRWLEALERAKLKDVGDAARLGWVAYVGGRYAQASRWLNLQKTDTAVSLWLQSKLARRAGRLADATRIMASAINALEKNPGDSRDGSAFVGSAHGDVAVLHLSHADFEKALDEFIGAGFSIEGDYVAEQMLGTNELIAYVKKNYPDESKGTDLRSLLARRLVREDRYEEARSYFQQGDKELLDQYVALLSKAADVKLPKMERARAWFDAGNLVLASGGNLMDYSSSPVETYRDRTPIPGGSLKGKISKRNLLDIYEEKPDPKVVTPTVTTDEKRRIAKYKAPAFKVGFIRHVASKLMWKAAELLPDNSDELADVLNSTGNRLRGDYRGDDDAADKFFQAIERRASQTPLGKEAGAKHWFVDRSGPWSVAAKGER